MARALAASAPPGRRRRPAHNRSADQGRHGVLATPTPLSARPMASLLTRLSPAPPSSPGAADGHQGGRRRSCGNASPGQAAKCWNSPAGRRCLLSFVFIGARIRAPGSAPPGLWPSPSSHQNWTSHREVRNTGYTQLQRQTIARQLLREQPSLRPRAGRGIGSSPTSLETRPARPPIPGEVDNPSHHHPSPHPQGNEQDAQARAVEQQAHIYQQSGNPAVKVDGVQDPHGRQRPNNAQTKVNPLHIATPGNTARPSRSAQKPAPSEGRGALYKSPNLATEGSPLRLKPQTRSFDA